MPTMLGTASVPSACPWWAWTPSLSNSRESNLEGIEIEKLDLKSYIDLRFWSHSCHILDYLFCCLLQNALTVSDNDCQKPWKKEKERDSKTDTQKCNTICIPHTVYQWLMLLNNYSKTCQLLKTPRNTVFNILQHVFY